MNWIDTSTERTPQDLTELDGLVSDFNNVFAEEIS